MLDAAADAGQQQPSQKNCREDAVLSGSDGFEDADFAVRSETETSMILMMPTAPSRGDDADAAQEDIHER